MRKQIGASKSLENQLERRVEETRDGEILLSGLDDVLSFCHGLRLRCHWFRPFVRSQGIRRVARNSRPKTAGTRPPNQPPPSSGRRPAGTAATVPSGSA